MVLHDSRGGNEGDIYIKQKKKGPPFVKKKKKKKEC